MRGIPFGMRKHSIAIRIGLLVSIFAVSAFAQGISPFAQSLNALYSFMTGTFAHTMSIVMIVYGLYQVAWGHGQHHGSLGSLALGIGGMAWAPTVYTWFFPNGA